MATADSIYTPIGSQSGLIGISEAAKQYSISIGHLRRQKDLPTYRIGRGKRRYLRSDLDRFFGKVQGKNVSGGQTQIAIYCRVSDGKRSKGIGQGLESDLSRQRDRLLDHVRNELGPDTKIQIYCETSSGLNFERRQFNKLVDSMLSGEFKDGIIYATTRERIMRLGLPLFEKICRFANVQVIYTEHDEAFENDEAESPAQLITEFMASIISKIYSKRSSLRNTRKLSPHVIERIEQLRKDGYSINRLTTIINSEGFKTDCGGPIGYSVVERILRTELKERPTLEVDKKNSIERFYAENVVRGASNLRLQKSVLYDAYLEYCQSRNIKAAGPTLLGRILSGRIEVTGMIVSGASTACYKGIYLKNDPKAARIVKEHKRPQTAANENCDSFTLYYQTRLAGSGRTIEAAKLRAEYLAWAKLNKLKPIKLPQIPGLLATIAGIFSERGKSGHVLYEFKASKKSTETSLPLGQKTHVSLGRFERIPRNLNESDKICRFHRV